MRIATWNVNSVRARLERLTAWLSESRPDVVLLQETKCVDEQFPREPLEELGYRVAHFGQKHLHRRRAARAHDDRGRAPGPGRRALRRRGARDQRADRRAARGLG